MAPDDYWTHTLSELWSRIEGAQKRHEREWDRTSWAIAHLLNVSGKSLKRNVTPDQLLGREREITPQDPVADFEELWRRVEKRRHAASEHEEDMED